MSRLCSCADVMQLTGMSRPTIFNLARDGLLPEPANTPGKRGQFWRASDIRSFFDHYGRDVERWTMHVELVRLWIENFGLFAADKDAQGKPLNLDVVARSLALSAWHLVSDAAVPLEKRVSVVTLLSPIDWSIAMGGRKLTPAQMRAFTTPARAIHELHHDYRADVDPGNRRSDARTSKSGGGSKRPRRKTGRAGR